MSDILPYNLLCKYDQPQPVLKIFCCFSVVIQVSKSKYQIFSKALF